jgi:hypothetical protein
MKNITPSLLLLVLAFFSLFSCSSEEVKSSDNFITDFEIGGIKGEIKDDIGQIYIPIFAEGYNAILNINAEPNIKVSPGATKSDNCQTWKENFSCTVTAENGDEKNYSVYIDVIRKKYSFEEWVLSSDTAGYYVPSGSNSSWSSGNAGISMALGMLFPTDEDYNKKPEHYPTKKTAEGYSGSAVLMETIEGGYIDISIMKKDIPLISGNFFLGNFNVAKLLSDELAATEVGRIYPAKPKAVKGYYKYKQGDGVFQNNGVPEPGRQDLCNMSVWFYKSDLPNGKDTTLTVRNIDEASDLVIGKAINDDCLESEEFEPFELEIEYTGTPDFANHRYKLAITFAASKKGDEYAGKIGSKFIIDEIEIEDY